MNDDLAYVSARLPDYRSYAEESDRHDSDMRVRAFVGEALTDARARLDGSLAAAVQTEIDALLMQCMFADQAFVHAFQHADLDAPMIAALVRSDRTLVEYAERVRSVDAAGTAELFAAIEKQFVYRRAPEPIG